MIACARLAMARYYISHNRNKRRAIPHWRASVEVAGHDVDHKPF